MSTETDSEQVSLYARYLAARWIIDRLNSLGVELSSIRFHCNRWTAGALTESQLDQLYSFYFHIALERNIDWLSPGTAEETESLSELVLEKVPGSRIYRREGNIEFYGEVPGLHHIRWHLTMGAGVCERVQVGTRTVMRPDPSVPLIEVEEPIFETRCVDPLAKEVLQ